MQTVSTQFERELRDVVGDVIAEQINEIAAGNLASLDEYKYLCGKIEGLRMVLGYFEQINTKLSE